MHSESPDPEVEIGSLPQSAASPGQPPETPHAHATMLAEVADGLSRVQKELPSKYFYDRRGSELFEAITRLPEYYLTRAERAILSDWMPKLMARQGFRSLLELGAGSGWKTRVILDAMDAARQDRTYVPVDVSATTMDEMALRFRAFYPRLTVRPVVGDITRLMRLPEDLDGPVCFAFLGSTIGNLHTAEAILLLRQIRGAMSPADRLLLGVDLRKDPQVIERAYNDAEGLTAEFNRNILWVLNRELGSDFDPHRFEHEATYDRLLHRIEMHLRAVGDQTVDIPGLDRVWIRSGETLRTEISGKYDRESIERLFEASGLHLAEWRTDPEGLFALVLGDPRW